ncbi:MAG: 4Fe-4S binding protein [Caldilineaceae bacterium]
MTIIPSSCATISTASSAASACASATRSWAPTPSSAGRGFASHIATPFDGIMVGSSCVFCSSCVQVCPTAALTPKPRMGQGRAWEFDRTRTICGYCGVGCGVEFLLKDGEIIGAQGYGRAGQQ